MPEHRLDDLHVDASGDGQRRCRVTKCVGCDAGKTSSLHRRLEACASEVPDPQDPTLRRCEYERVLRATGHQAREVVDHEPRYRHRSTLVTFWRAEDRLAVHLSNSLRDGGSPAHQVESTYSKSGHLSEPDAGVGEKQHRYAVVARFGRERVDLGMAEVALFRANGAWQRNTDGRIACEPSVANRETEQERKHAVGLPDRRGGETLSLEASYPGSDRLMGNCRQRHVAPGRDDVILQQILIAGSRGRLQVDLRSQPAWGPLVHLDPRRLRVDVGAGADSGGYRVQPALRVDFSCEVARVLLTVRVAVASPPATVVSFRDVCHVDRLPAVRRLRLAGDEISAGDQAAVGPWWSCCVL